MKSVIEAESNLIRSQTIRIRDLTINQKYAEITSYIPSGMANFLFAAINNIASGYFGVVTANGRYFLIDVPDNTVIAYVEVKYFYTD